MVPDMMVHKYDTLVGEGGGGKGKKVFIIGVLEKNPKPTEDKYGMDTLSMVTSIVERTCFGVVNPLVS